MSWWQALAGMGLSLAQPGAVADRADGPLFTVNDYVADADQESGNWVGLINLRGRVLIPAGPQRDMFLRLFAAAAETGVSLRLRIDAGAGRLSADGSLVQYPLCSIAAGGGASFGDEARNCPRRASASSAAERLLALGIAQVFEHPEAARQSLATALAATPALPVRAQALALGFRGEAAESAAQNFPEGSADQDRLIAEALADFRRQVALAPDEPEPRYAVARMLLMLGGYGEALRVYDAIGRRWPGEAFNIAIRTGALYRQQGDHARALRQLDDHARAYPGSATGMRFHYHRAWTLMTLNRFEEAGREIEQGFVSQPDYSSAYQLRSCIRARLGQMQEALADQQRALELLEAIAAQPTESLRVEIARSRAIVDSLREALARGERTLLTACGMWDRWTRPRSPSPLLAGGPSPH